MANARRALFALGRKLTGLWRGGLHLGIEHKVEPGPDPALDLKQEQQPELDPEAAYQRQVKGELVHYERIFEVEQGREKLLQPVPPSWIEMELRAADLIRAATGNDPTGHLLTRLNRDPGTRTLSLGSGPGGVELGFAEQAPNAQIDCIDLSPNLLELGRQRAAELQLNVTFGEGDLNRPDLPHCEFDVVFCHAALHHLIELERLAEQIRTALRPDGVLIVVDIITANGYGMWPETRQVVQAIWRTLPEKFRVNHTGYDKPRLDDQIWEADTSASTMECVRSADILPVLNNSFAAEYYVPYFSICRRFLDTMYGPNYDLAEPLDRALVEWLWQLDRFYTSSGRLRPETFFGIYRNVG